MRIPTPAQQAASRANSARSTGPQTAAGKRRSSANALRHGLLAKTIVLDSESQVRFEKMCRQYVRRLAPRDALEVGALEEICSAAWRLRRLWCMERKALDLEIAGQESPDPEERTLRAFNSLARHSPSFLLLHRYESRLHNIIQRSLSRIHSLRKCGVPSEAGQPSENKDSLGAAPSDFDVK